MSHFIQVDRRTNYLLPPSVDKWLPEDHLARFVVDVVERLDLSELTGHYTGRGSKAHHPQVLLGLLVYGYATEATGAGPGCLAPPCPSAGPRLAPAGRYGVF